MVALGEFFKKKEEPKEHFWSLVIGKGWVESAIWRVEGTKTEVVAKGGSFSWQEGEVESLVQAADSSLSAAASVGQEAVEPSKVVFGLPSSWTLEGNIKKEYLELLKKLSSELELTPTGFVSLQEALVHFLKAQEGVPANAILIGLSEQTLDVTLVQNGSILLVEEVSRSISLAADVAEGLARMTLLSQLPSRIIVYNHKPVDLDEARQQLIASNWAKLNLSFLHTPKVEALPETVSIAAVSLAGGAEVSGATSVEVLAEEEIAEEEVSPAEEIGAEAPVVEEEGKEQEADLADLGEDEVDAKDLGFVEEDIAQKPSLSRLSPQTAFEEATQGKKQEGQKKNFSTFLLSLARRVKLPVMPRLSFPRLPFKGFGLLGIVGVFLIIVSGAAFLAWWYLPKARVVIYVAPEKLEKTISFSVDTQNLSLDVEKGVIPAEVIKLEVSGDRTIATTGARTVGESAKGRVIIYHVGPEVELEQGTFLTGPDSLKFTLDEAVSILAGTSLTSPSKTEASITAVQLGAQYNLAADTEFSVGSFSKADYVAKNEEALSGGVSREVAAVSGQDLARLEKELSGELLKKGVSKLKTDLPKEYVLLEESSYLEAGEASFSHKEGEETANLKLELSSQVLVFRVLRQDLNSLVEKALERDIPQGFVLGKEQTEITYKAQEEGGFSAEILANLLPKINPDEVKRAIAGKYPKPAEDYLSTISGFKKAELINRLKLPGRLGTLPHQPGNITVEIVAAK